MNIHGASRKFFWRSNYDLLTLHVDTFPLLRRGGLLKPAVTAHLHHSSKRGTETAPNHANTVLTRVLWAKEVTTPVSRPHTISVLLSGRLRAQHTTSAKVCPGFVNTTELATLRQAHQRRARQRRGHRQLSTGTPPEGGAIDPTCRVRR